MTDTDLNPGYRADVLVRATDDNGNALPEGLYWLVDDGSPPPRRNLARVWVKGKRKRMDLPTQQELRPLAPFKPIEDSELTGTQIAVYSVNLGPPPSS